MTIQLTTTHRRILGAVIGAWLGIQLTILSGWFVLMLGLPLLGVIVLGVLDRSGRLLGGALGLAAGLMAAEVFGVVFSLTLGSVVAWPIYLPIVVLVAAAVSVVMTRSIRLLPATVAD